MTEFLQVMTVADCKETAVRLARSAVAARLAASAQVFGPVMSMFWHHGQLGDGEEWQVILKTTGDQYQQLRDHLIAEHTWDNPEITAITLTEGTKEYFSWLKSNVNQTA